MSVLVIHINKHNKDLSETIKSVKSVGQYEQLIFSKYKTQNDLEHVICSPLDNLYKKALEYGKSNKHDYSFIIEDTVTLCSDCISIMINYLNNWRETYGYGSYMYSMVFSDLLFSGTKNKEYLSSININTADKINSVIDCLLVDNNALVKVDDVKSNKELVLWSIINGLIPLHLPEALYHTNFKNPKSLVSQ